ncbi:hypothetical protein HRbin04_00593 [archaeon HR04]|jgi:hypothetical protein|nr:hypothetical protein HRbin04_00593 [archaeon HR04]
MDTQPSIFTKVNILMNALSFMYTIYFDLETQYLRKEKNNKILELGIAVAGVLTDGGICELFHENEIDRL